MTNKPLFPQVEEAEVALERIEDFIAEERAGLDTRDFEIIRSTLTSLRAVEIDTEALREAIDNAVFMIEEECKPVEEEDAEIIVNAARKLLSLVEGEK